MGGSTTATTKSTSSSSSHCKSDVTNLLLLTLFSLLSIIYLYLLLPTTNIVDTIKIKLPRGIDINDLDITRRDTTYYYKEYVNYYVKLSEDMGLKLEQEEEDIMMHLIIL